MGNITDITYISDKINDESMTFLAERLNAGYEVMKLEVNWVQESYGAGENKGVTNTPVIIAILCKCVHDGENDPQEALPEA